MVEDMVDATVGFRGQVGVDQLQQQIPAAGQEFCHHCLVKGEVHLQEINSLENWQECYALHHLEDQMIVTFKGKKEGY